MKSSDDLLKKFYVICSILQTFFHLHFTADLMSVSIPPLLEIGPGPGVILFEVIPDVDNPEKLTLPCIADSLPPPSYSWFKNGKYFSTSFDDVMQIPNEGTIVFKNPQPNIEGDYQCVATNAAGSVYSDIAKVRRASVISFPKEEPRVVTAKLGQPLSLKCDNPGGYPPPAMHWVLQEPDGSLRSIISDRVIADDRGTLWFSSVTQEDATKDALYACAASSSTRTEYQMGNWVYLNVTDNGVEVPSRVEPFLQMSSEDEMTVLVGDDVKLFCVFGGIPTPEIRWWRKNRRLIPKYHITEYGKVLELLNIRENEEDTYFCEAKNSVGKSAKQSFEVNLESVPKFTKVPGTISRPVGDSATFNCEATGEPEPAITWSINGEPLEPSNQPVLYFGSLEIKNKGVIACNASNKHGFVYSTGFLNVLSLPPEFTNQPEDTYADVGEPVSLTCVGYGAPDPEVQWKKFTDDMELRIKDDENYDITKSALIIKSLSEDTQGHYECRVFNKFGSVSAMVEVKLRKSTTVDVSTLKERNRAGDSITIRCDVTLAKDIDEIDVSWFKDDEVVVTDDRRIFDEESSDESGLKHDRILVIRDSKVKDSGLYACVSITDKDESSDSVLITVEDVPNEVELLGVRCSDGEATIRWVEPIEATPILGFILEAQSDLNGNEWMERNNEISASHTSVKMDLNSGHSYKFRIIAVNRVGSSEPSEPTEFCNAPGSVPTFNPKNVSTKVIDSLTVKVTWSIIPPNLHNGKNFRYIIRWKQLDTDDVDESIIEDKEHKHWSHAEIDDWEQNEVEIDGLNRRKQYKIQALAANEYGTATPVNDIWIATDLKTPNFAPQFLRVRRVTNMSAILFWIPVPLDKLPRGIKGYQIDIRESGHGTAEDDDDDDLVTDGQTSRAILTGLDPYTLYEARVRVWNWKKPGPYSKKIRFRTDKGKSSAVENLKSISISSNDIIVGWDPPSKPGGLITGYEIRYGHVTRNAFEEKFLQISAENEEIKLIDLLRDTMYKITVLPINNSPYPIGERSTVQIETHSIESSEPAVPNFTWKLVLDDQHDQDEEQTTHNEDVLDKIVILSDANKDGKIDEKDVQDVDKDGDVDDFDLSVADVNDDGVIDAKDVKDGDRDGDGDIDRSDIGDEDGDGKLDDEDILDGEYGRFYSIDDADIVLKDVDGNGLIDEDDSIDVDRDGDIDKLDLGILDINDDGIIDVDDLKLGDENGDGQVDKSELRMLDDEFLDIDLDGDVDEDDYANRHMFVGDTDGDGDVDRDDILDIDGDGDIDQSDFDVADINNDGLIDINDVKAADRDGDGDVDASDIGDEDGDGDVDGTDVIIADEDGDGDIDAQDDDEENVIFEDKDGDGDLDEHDVGDVDGDGDVDEDDFNMIDVNDDGKIDADDIAIMDKDKDGDVDAADIVDINQDGVLNELDFEVTDRDGDGDIDSTDFKLMGKFLTDSDGDGDIDKDDVLDTDGDGDIDARDFDVADINNDGVVDIRDLKAGDVDGDGDIDISDIGDEDGDGDVDGSDVIAADEDGDGDIDSSDDDGDSMLFKDRDNDGIIELEDVADLDGDGDIDQDDINVLDIDNDGDVDADDIKEMDKDGDGDIDAADVHDEDNDGDVDGKDLLISEAEEDKGVTVQINWKPNLDQNPGSEFFVRYRRTGAESWEESSVEKDSLTQELSHLSPAAAYEIQMVARDGQYETPSETIVIGPFSELLSTKPTPEAVMDVWDPFYMTWFVVALFTAALMALAIVCSVWIYHRRVSRVAELRADLYKNYVPPPPTTKSKSKPDLEDIKDIEEQPLTAEQQRQQISSLVKRQGTVQSVDSFASNDDDFAEYGDESMAIDLLNSLSEHTRQNEPTKK